MFSAHETPVTRTEIKLWYFLVLFRALDSISVELMIINNFSNIIPRLDMQISKCD